MREQSKYNGDDLVALVWPRQSELLVRAGHQTWEDVARGDWAMDASKAERVRLLIAVFEDVVVGAWEVTGAKHHAEAPAGKSRQVSRSRFDTVHDPRLSFLVGTPSPRAAQRNPQATFELRDLPGCEALTRSTEPASHGLVRLGEFTLAVSEDGRAELHMPIDAALTIRTSSN